jgi:hypothetical protein
MDSNLQNKLQQFSATPPDSVWNKIADALDTEESLSQRLYNYEENPPAAVWQKVEEGLEENPAPAKVIPFTTRFRIPIRYTAVACFLAVVLVTITLTVKRTEAGSIEAESNTTVPANHSTAANNSKEQKNTSTRIASSSEQNETGADESAQQTSTNISVPEKKNNAIASAETEHTGKRKNVVAAYSSLNEYVFFNDGDGKLRKVSKKLASFVNCKDGDTGCKQHLQQLRQKMAAKAMTTDFTGILEMLRQLQ